MSGRWLDKSWAQKTLLLRNASVVLEQNRVLTIEYLTRYVTEKILTNSQTMAYNKAVC